MSRNPITVTGRAISFSPDEFIVSKTNAKGIITYVNDVFLRVSGYTPQEILGKPHNVIRHPWMPRCIFKLLWERIKEGKEIFAYVVNIAKNGDHYWVLAHVTPSFDRAGAIIGYHSNRRVPKPDAVRKVEALYKELRALEDAAPTPQAGMEASAKKLHEWIQANGGNYDALVFTL